MRVIGVGLGRTGTASLRIALERLGYGPCYHMHEVMREPSRARAWLADEPDWEQIFEGYDSTVDWPGAAYWRELIARYPDARVILTVRDPHEWHRSMDATILRALRQTRSPVTGRLMRLGARLRPDLHSVLLMLQRVVLDRSLGGHPDGDEERFVRLFEEHTAAVTGTVPADRLLVLEVADGWKPLCDFLGTTAPDEPFPHVNEREEFGRLSRAQRRRSLTPIALTAAAAAAAVLARQVWSRRVGR